MLFDREDGVVTLCEIKYAEKMFVLEKSEAKNLINKIEVFEKYAPVKKTTFFALVTTIGLKSTMWSEELLHNVVTLEDLIKF